jgi:hypothetical protein
LDDFQLPASIPQDIELETDSAHRSLVLDSTATDGLVIETIRVADSTGRTHTLFEAS